MRKTEFKNYELLRVNTRFNMFGKELGTKNNIQVLCKGTYLLFLICYTIGFSLSCFSSESSSEPEKEDKNGVDQLRKVKRHKSVELFFFFGQIRLNVSHFLE